MRNYIEHLARFLSSKQLKTIEILAIAILLFAVYGRNLLAVEFQPDETFWIVSSVRFDKFVDGEFDSPVWAENPLISFEVRPIPSYMAAMGQRAGGIRAQDLPNYWDWSLSKAENISNGAMPSERVLVLSRVPMMLISVLSLIGIIDLLGLAHSRLAGYLFTLASLNDYFLLHLRRAMSEASLLLFTVLGLYASYMLLRAIRQESGRKIVVWSVLVGILSGLAGQSKLTGLAGSVIAILGTLILVCRSEDISARFRNRTFLTVTLLTVSTSLLMFYISYPFFYQNTLHRILTTFYVRGQVVQSQIDTYPEQVIAWSARPAILFTRIFRYPLNFGTAGITGILCYGLNFLMACTGLVDILTQIGRKSDKSEFFIVLILGTIVCAVPMLLVPLDWDRYYVYPIVFNCIFFAIGFSRFVLMGYSKMQRPARLAI